MNQIPLINQALLWERRLQIESERLEALHSRRYQDEGMDQKPDADECENPIICQKELPTADNLHICTSMKSRCQEI
jgi:hypothetical protein